MSIHSYFTFFFFFFSSQASSRETDSVPYSDVPPFIFLLPKERPFTNVPRRERGSFLSLFKFKTCTLLLALALL